MTRNLKHGQEKSLRQRALEYLGKREYSAYELANKLKTHTDEAGDIPALISEFKERGWLSDVRFTEQLVRVRKMKFGSAKIANELREKGVSDELIAKAVSDVEESELENAMGVWRKKYNQPANDRNEWEKQARFLQSRGFGFDTIKALLKAVEDDND
jgi:regulatory protein